VKVVDVVDVIDMENSVKIPFNMAQRNEADEVPNFQRPKE